MIHELAKFFLVRGFSRVVSYLQRIDAALDALGSVRPPTKEEDEKMAKWIKGAVKRPGRIKAMASRLGISTSAAARRSGGSSNKSLAAAGRLAKRFQSREFKGGNTTLSPGDLKYSMAQDRNDNLAFKNEYTGNRNYARSTTFDPNRQAPQVGTHPVSDCGENPGTE